MTSMRFTYSRRSSSSIPISAWARLFGGARVGDLSICTHSLIVARTLAIQNESDEADGESYCWYTFTLLLTRRRSRRWKATSLEALCHQGPGHTHSRYRYTAKPVLLRLPMAHIRPNWMSLYLGCIAFSIVILFSSVSPGINPFCESNSLMLPFSFCSVEHFQVENTDAVVGI